MRNTILLALFAPNLFACSQDVALVSPPDSTTDVETDTTAPVDTAGSDTAIENDTTPGGDSSGSIATCGSFGGLYTAVEDCHQSAFCVWQTGCDIRLSLAFQFMSVTGVATFDGWSATGNNGGCELRLENGEEILDCTSIEPGRRCVGAVSPRPNIGYERPCCDPFDNNACPSGQRCEFVEVSGLNWNIPACVPVDEPRVEGETCVKTADDCAPGLACISEGNTDGIARCARICAGPADCRVGEACLRESAAIIAGACVPSCDLLVDTCGDGQCTPVFSLRGEPGYGAAPVCLAAGTAEEGQTCRFYGATTCKKGLACLGNPIWTNEFGGAVPTFACRRMCFNDDDCNGNGQCRWVFAGESNAPGMCLVTP